MHSAQYCSVWSCSRTTQLLSAFYCVFASSCPRTSPSTDILCAHVAFVPASGCILQTQQGRHHQVRGLQQFHKRPVHARPSCANASRPRSASSLRRTVRFNCCLDPWLHLCKSSLSRNALVRDTFSSVSRCGSNNVLRSLVLIHRCARGLASHPCQTAPQLPVSVSVCLSCDVFPQSVAFKLDAEDNKRQDISSTATDQQESVISCLCLCVSRCCVTPCDATWLRRASVVSHRSRDRTCHRCSAI